MRQGRQCFSPAPYNRGERLDTRGRGGAPHGYYWSCLCECPGAAGTEAPGRIFCLFQPPVAAGTPWLVGPLFRSASAFLPGCVCAPRTRGPAMSLGTTVQKHFLTPAGHTRADPGAVRGHLHPSLAGRNFDGTPLEPKHRPSVQPRPHRLSPSSPVSPLPAALTGGALRPKKQE